jgi:hypothetical protein
MEYREKIMFGLSIRQLLCFGAAILSGAATWFFCDRVLGLSLNTVSYIIIAEAAPLMALGFIQKDGMLFEKYAALVLRHRLGRLHLHFESAPMSVTMPGSATNAAAPRKEKRKFYARVAEQNHPQRECEGFTVTKKERQRKRKAAQRKIAAARQECRAAKRRAEKAAPAGGRAKEYLPMHKIQADVRGRRL